MEWGWKEQQAANTLVIVGTQKILTWVDFKKISEYFVGYGFFIDKSKNIYLIPRKDQRILFNI